MGSTNKWYPSLLKLSKAMKFLEINSRESSTEEVKSYFFLKLKLQTELKNNKYKDKNCYFPSLVPP